MATRPNNEEFMREVDEALRADQMAGFWKRWGLWLIVAVLLVLAAFGGWMWWQSRENAKAEAAGETFSGALTDLEAGRRQGIEAKLAPLTTSETDGYRAVSQLTLAAVKLQAGDLKGAAAGYRAVAEDETLPKPYRDLALVRWTAAEYDTLRPQQVIDRLGRLAQKGSPWFGSAGEMVAAAYLASNRPKQAGPLFAAIAGDEAVPESIRQRAVQMAGVLGVDAVADAGGDGAE